MHAYNAKYIPLQVTSHVIEVSFSYMVAYLRLCTAMLRHNKKFHKEEVADCSVRLFVGQVMGGGFNPHQPHPEYATGLLQQCYALTCYTVII